MSRQVTNEVSEQSVGGLMTWMKSWPDWLLVLCFLILAVVFAFMGVLDDWARAVLAVVFIAIAMSLVARERLHHSPHAGEAGAPPPPPPAPDTADVSPDAG